MRLKLIGFALLIALLPVLAIAARPRGAHSQGFIVRSGQQLLLDGQPWRFHGVNRYNLMTRDSPYQGCGESWTDAQLDAWFSEVKQTGSNVVRLWAFQKFDLKRLDVLINLARKYDLYLLPVLENQWAACTEGGYKDSNWYSYGFVFPYGAYPLSYLDYIKVVVSHFKNEPRIFAWQLINEMEGQKPDGTYDYNALYNWAWQASRTVKAYDPNHLLSLGASSLWHANPTFYKSLHALPTIDLLEYHDYGEEATAAPTDLQTIFGYAASLAKPVFIGEAGIKSNCPDPDCYAPPVRAAYFDAKLGCFFNQPGAVGYLIWSFRDRDLPIQDYQFDLPDPLTPILNRYP